MNKYIYIYILYTLIHIYYTFALFTVTAGKKGFSVITSKKINVIWITA